MVPKQTAKRMETSFDPYTAMYSSVVHSITLMDAKAKCFQQVEKLGHQVPRVSHDRLIQHCRFQESRTFAAKSASPLALRMLKAKQVVGAACFRGTRLASRQCEGSSAVVSCGESDLN